MEVRGFGVRGAVPFVEGFAENLCISAERR